MTSNTSLDPVPLPSMIDDEFIATQRTASSIRPDGKPAIIAFFVKALELYGIVGDILQDLYVTSGESQRSKASILMSVLGFDDRLTAWDASLPEHLRPNTSTVIENDMYRRQMIVLRIR